MINLYTKLYQKPCDNEQWYKEVSFDFKSINQIASMIVSGLTSSNTIMQQQESLDGMPASLSFNELETTLLADCPK